MWHRRLAAAALLPACLLLAGCTMTGTVDVVGDDAELDLVLDYRTVVSVTNFEGVRLPLGTDYCAFSFTGLRVELLDAAPGRTSCRLTGSIAVVGDDSQVAGMLTVARSSGYYFVATPQWTLTENVRDPLDEVDVTIRFPGRVVAASAGAELADTSARWRDPRALRAEGFHVTAAEAPSLPTWGTPAAIGLAAGALGAAAVTLLRRPSRPGPDGDGPDPDGPDAALPEALSDDSDPSRWGSVD